ncbi:alpha-glucuronidase [Caldicoprobacter guelmensis]|nr:alpha-glucuronidase [Caldicoprobacter guelmensis]
MDLNKSSMYECWLNYKHLLCNFDDEYKRFCSYIVARNKHSIINAALEELKFAFTRFMGRLPEVVDSYPDSDCMLVGTLNDTVNETLRVNHGALPDDGFIVQRFERNGRDVLAVIGKNEKGVLYGVFHLLRSMCCGRSLA